MIKDAVLNIPSDASRDTMIGFAVSVAELFRSHLTGIAFVYQPTLAMVEYSGASAEYIDGLWATSRERAAASIDAFNEATRRAGVLAETQQVDSNLGGAAYFFAKAARRFDLAIVRQADPDHPSEADPVAEAALFDSGRPVLVAPYIQAGGVKLNRVTVCWDGSRTAARAVADALPLLARAAAIDVLIIDDRQIKSDEVLGADIGQHLARHDLKVEINHTRAMGIDVSDVILSHVAETGADLIIMGGYGHSRTREFVLGGATRGILAAMTVPVLMSH